MKIKRFEYKYGFLSNFYPCSIKCHGREYSTLEHAYQAYKTLNPLERDKIMRASTPGHAKRLGRRVSLRTDWEKVKVEVMYDLLKRKFARGTDLAVALVETEDAELEEGNWWGDTFWGTHYGKGENMLGKLLMRVRKELMEE